MRNSWVFCLFSIGSPRTGSLSNLSLLLHSTRVHLFICFDTHTLHPRSCISTVDLFISRRIGHWWIKSFISSRNVHRSGLFYSLGYERMCRLQKINIYISIMNVIYIYLTNVFDVYIRAVYTSIEDKVWFLWLCHSVDVLLSPNSPVRVCYLPSWWVSFSSSFYCCSDSTNPIRFFSNSKRSISPPSILYSKT